METSRFTLSDCDSPSPAFCGSLCACSSHDFSSLQSPSAFPSCSPDHYSQQIELSKFDDADQCPSLLHHGRFEASFDINQPHLTLGLEARHEESIQDGSLCQDGFSPSPSGQDNFPAFGGESHTWSHASSAQHSSPLLTCDSNAIHLDNVIKDCNFQAHEAHVQINQPPQIDAYQAHETLAQINQTPQVNAHGICGNLSDVGPSALTSIKQVASTATDKNDKDRERIISFQEVHHRSESKVRKIQAIDSLSLHSSAFLRFECTKATKQEPLHEINECRKVEIRASKEVVTSRKSTLEGLKENLNPQSFKKEFVRGGGLKGDSAGWMCPRDAKKAFKAKPRQVLLDKWLTKQR